MKVKLICLFILVLLTPLPAVCQLAFNIDLDDGIDFGEVIVDEEEERVITASLVEGEGQARWWFRGDDDCFSFDPDGVYFEPRGVVQQDITLRFSPGEAADYEVTFMIEFEDEDENQLYTYQVVLTGTGVNQNRDPIITDPDEERLEVHIDEAERLLIEFTAEDPDDDDLTWSIADEGGMPDGWEFTDNEDGTAQFDWTPSFQDEGEYDPLFRVEDDNDGSDEIRVIITVDRWDPQLRWEEIPERVEVRASQLLEFTVIGGGPEEFTICYMSDDLPDDVELEFVGMGRCNFSWQTTFEDEGEYTATFILETEEFALEGNVEIIVLNGHIPYWEDIPQVIEVDENQVVEFIVEGIDQDEDELAISYSSEDLPEAVEFMDEGNGIGTFVWQTTFDDAGEYTATFTLSDGEFNIAEDVTITVLNVNRAPLWVAYPEEVEIDEGQLLEFVIIGIDPDRDDVQITYSSDNLPESVEFNDVGDGTAVFSWQPSFEDAGEYTATFTISDGDLENEAGVHFTVMDTDHIFCQNDGSIPKVLSLSHAYPNPFNSTTTIRYSLPMPTDVSLEVYNLAGQQITTLFEGQNQAGIHTTTLTANDLPSGLYFVKLNAGGQVFTRKVMLIR
ncbi:MAG: T9SS type A sorting domain-containing protein [Calditrichaeota bacterium]|nr:T9SS type A sorting domain-containing protein [Calditrichota bacterium]